MIEREREVKELDRQLNHFYSSLVFYGLDIKRDQMIGLKPLII